MLQPTFEVAPMDSVGLAMAIYRDIGVGGAIGRMEQLRSAGQLNQDISLLQEPFFGGIDIGARRFAP